MKLKLTTRIILSAVAFAFVFGVITLGFWLAGFNFDKRGDTMIGWFVLSIGLGVATEAWTQGLIELYSE